MSDIVEGDVVRRRMGVGSKSERDAVVIDTGDATFVLRRRGGNAFADPQLDALVGRRARLEGTSMSATFVVDRWELLDQV
jgi:hypothetical protein